MRLVRKAVPETRSHTRSASNTRTIALSMTEQKPAGRARRMKSRAATLIRQIPAPAFTIAIITLSLTLALSGSIDLIARGLTVTFLPDGERAPQDTVKKASPPPAPDSSNLVAVPELEKLQPLPPSKVDSEVLWLARVIYSETKRPQEQELVAWVVRNRVETRYRGKSTYQGVVLDRLQFSAFNGGRTRQFYSSLTPYSRTPGWQTALSIAYTVKHAPPQMRPFSLTTRHFYSEQSMVGRRHPTWAADKRPVKPLRPYDIDPKRFRFYAGVY